MRYVIYFGLSLLAVVLQSCVLVNINTGGIYPDVVLCLVMSIALLQGPYAGIFIGLFAGLTLDIVSSDILGYFALQYTLLGFFASLFNARPRPEGLVRPVVFAAVGYVLLECIRMIIVYFSGTDFVFWNAMWRYVLPSALFTGAWMFLTHLGMRKLCATQIMHPYNTRDPF